MAKVDVKYPFCGQTESVKSMVGERLDISAIVTKCVAGLSSLSMLIFLIFQFLIKVIQWTSSSVFIF